MSWREVREAAIQKAFADVPDYVKEDVVEAAAWAKETLTNHEGSGHCFDIFPDKSGGLVFNFHKPAWAGDHTGRHMPYGGQAIVMAVCEYLNGG